MNCANCGAVNPEGAKFCSNCGNSLSLACVNCGTKLAPEAKFCFNCGHPVGPPAPTATSQPPTPAAPAMPVPPAASTPAYDSGADPLQQYIPKEFLSKLE